MALASRVVVVSNSVRDEVFGREGVSTAKVEESMLELRKSRTIVLVTNNTKQAARIGTRTAFFLMGEMVEIGPTAAIFTAPADKRTEDYIVGRFG